ncbi:S9 family peptidase [Arsenicicoccus dermatophilus]|uniref:S9 family peptidase n=1 Tax=Arsenicicoccus dermatophilus TaxID=1076331 RepID=UPI0039171F72
MTSASLPEPPRARRVETTRTHHGESVSDPYEWLRDKSSPEVIAHLEAENAYTAAMTADQEPLRRAIFEELKARVQETDLSVPVAYRGWWYYSRTTEGEQYARECRVVVADTPDGVPGPPPQLVDGAPPEGEQVLLDGPALAQGHEFFGVGSTDVSHDGTRFAYAVDTTGDERYDLVITEVPTDPTVTGVVGRIIDDQVTGIGYGLVFSLDGRQVYYTRNDDAWRQFQVWRHEIGTPVEQDVLVHDETDERFWVGVGSSRDDRWIVIATGSKTTSETWLIDSADPDATPRLVAPREEGVEYDVEPAGEVLLITHNATHQDFELAVAPTDATSRDQWRTILTPGEGERVVGVEAFSAYAVVAMRKDGLTALSVLDRPRPDELAAPRPLEFDEPIYTVHPGDNLDYDATWLRISYQSLVTPPCVYDVDLATLGRTLRKRTEVLGGVDLDAYEQRREWAIAPDGTRVPISLVYRKDTRPDGTHPGMLYAYGSYEACTDPWFSFLRFSLLDRGFVWALAHVRGGGEMGRAWYDQGKTLTKRNTFTDFVACGEHLVQTGWVAPDRLVAEGGSAGGLLIGAVANIAPDLFRALHAQVPFVDALTTILDPSLPLTVGEWEEWGDPLHDPEVYRYLRSYSPYENVAPRRYPSILATTSLNDTRVFYVEPAKWVARLRETVTNDPAERPVLLQTEMVAGHGGVSGRYDAWRQAAFEWAWLMTQAGVTR